jgi:phage terminase Nu1 subunit (DNA packaging protein)
MAKKWLTKAQAADALRVDIRSITRFEQQGLPVETQGGRKRYPWPEIGAWRDKDREAQIRREERARAERGKPQDYEEAKAREMAARAELAELDLAEKRGELALLSTVDVAWGRMVERLDAKLRGMVPLSVRLYGCKTPAELQTKLEVLVEEVREELRSGT